jgi:hypothetical protein
MNAWSIERFHGTSGGEALGRRGSISGRKTVRRGGGGDGAGESRATTGIGRDFFSTKGHRVHLIGLSEPMKQRAAHMPRKWFLQPMLKGAGIEGRARTCCDATGCASLGKRRDDVEAPQASKIG